MIKTNTSFEPDIFKIWKSWKKYDLSTQKLQSIFKNELLDLLSNDIFNIDIKKIKRQSRTSLLNILNDKLLELHHPNNIELFGVKEKKITKEEKEKYTKEKFPKTILTTLTHWTYSIPSSIRHKIKREIRKNILKINKEDLEKEVIKKYGEFIRILKHYSDFWTRYLVKNSFIPKKQIIYSKYSRWLKDPARNRKEKNRTVDFSNNALPKILYEDNWYWELSHIEYHLKISKKIDEIIKEEWWVILIDDHDTWILKINENEKLDSYKKWWFPVITLGTLDWESCNKEIIEYYAERIEYHLWIKPLINNPYKWGYVTKKHWKLKREELNTKWENPKKVNVIQQEIWKYLYLDEKKQKIDHSIVKLIWEWLARAKCDLWLKFWKEYFKAIKKWDDAVKKYLENYQEIN